MSNCNFINDFHRKNSMAAQREVQHMSLHPCSREQKLAQIRKIKEHSATTKESISGGRTIGKVAIKNIASVAVLKEIKLYIPKVSKSRGRFC